MKQPAKSPSDELRPQYDLKTLLKGAVRGKYAKQYQAGSNLVLIDPAIHRQFATDADVNAALRLVIELRKVGASRRKRGR